jgi:hypothetical protein
VTDDIEPHPGYSTSLDCMTRFDLHKSSLEIALRL